MEQKLGEYDIFVRIPQNYGEAAPVTRKILRISQIEDAEEKEKAADELAFALCKEFADISLDSKAVKIEDLPVGHQVGIVAVVQATIFDAMLPPEDPETGKVPSKTTDSSTPAEEKVKEASLP